ncbi:Lgl [Oopsacas minuta]|uniref:Lgl n=1 Tax=Oopsacas minuta TaxID=111878 RepID=A0A2P1GIW1_9METZ|nr:Lgl [Oopsacas minuta]KAI6653542.1 Lgl [Oopsacas minuta]
MTHFRRGTKRFGEKRTASEIVPHPKASAQQGSKNYFDFMITCKHGFPYKPSAICFDEESGLVALGTENGELRIYGRPGVEFRAAYESKIAIKLIFPLEGLYQFLTICADNSLFLWTLGQNGEKLHFQKILIVMDEVEKDFTVCSLNSTSSLFYMGSENGNVYLLDLKTLQLSSDVIYWNNATALIHSYARVHPGQVVAIEINPQDSTKVLIGFEKGAITLWNQMRNSPIKSFPGKIEEMKPLTSLSWHPDGYKFTSAHRDGTYIIWSVSLNQPEEPPFRPYGGDEECMGINKIIWLNPESQSLRIFSGGLPASFADKHTLSVMRGVENSCLEFSSRVVDFIPILDPSDKTGEMLMVLLEEELVCLDLKAENLNIIPKPYLHSIHASPLSKIAIYEGCSPLLVERLRAAQKVSKYALEISDISWPANGGCVREEVPLTRTILISGHEDGSVKFWDCSTQGMDHIYTLHTKDYFCNLDEESTSEEKDTFWPPFKRVGEFDPHTSDHRLIIRSIQFDPQSSTLVVGGEAGQVVILELVDQERLYEISNALCVVGQSPNTGTGRRLQGDQKLEIPTSSLQFSPGLQPIMVLLCHPAKPVTNIAFKDEWGIVAAGLMVGFAVVNYRTNTIVMTRSLNTNQEARQGKFQTVRRSMRSSWRRVSGRGPQIQVNIDVKHDRNQNTTINELVLAETLLQSNQPQPSLWVCTSSAMIIRYSIDVPAPQQMFSMPTMLNATQKQISLLHNAPVVGVILLDRTYNPLAQTHEIGNLHFPEPNLNSPTYAVIITEEQIKLISLPNLKNRNKYKFTEEAVGQRISKFSYIRVKVQESAKSRIQWSSGLLVLTQRGNLYAFTLPDLRLRRHATLLAANDIRGIESSTFTKTGEIFHLASSSELQRCRTCLHNQQYYLRQDPSLTPYDGSTGLDYIKRRMRRMNLEIPFEDSMKMEDDVDQVYDLPNSRPVVPEPVKINDSEKHVSSSDSSGSSDDDSGDDDAEPVMLSNPMAHSKLSDMIEESRKQTDHAKAFYKDIQNKTNQSISS